MGFIVPLQNFSHMWRRHYDRRRAANFDLCSARMAIEQGAQAIARILSDPRLP